MHLLESGDYSLDANVVVDFFKTDSLDLLSRLLPGRMIMSDLVAAELAEAKIFYPDPAVIPLDSDEAWQLFDDIRSNSRSLGVGEIAALVVAKLHGVGIVTNDSHARQRGKKLDLAVIGSIGLLEDAVGLKLLSPIEACAALDKIVKCGAWISNELVDLFMRSMKDRVSPGSSSDK